MEMTFAPFNIKELIETNVLALAPLAEKKGLELTSDVNPQAGRIVSDAKRVQQILINLVNNAIKFTDKGYVRVECEVKDEQVITRVVDTGIGIKAEEIEHIFESFRQIDTGLARLTEGTGLGLAICKKLAQMLGGQIQVQSQWGKGSTFTLILPIKKEG